MNMDELKKQITFPNKSLDTNENPRSPDLIVFLGFYMNILYKVFYAFLYKATYSNCLSIF